MSCTGDREIRSVSGRVGTYAIGETIHWDSQKNVTKIW